MDKSFIKKGLLWGFLLWLFGYILGILFFAFLPQNIMGWVIMPFGIASTLYVLSKKLLFQTKDQAIFLGISWSLIAIISDYLFLVLIFRPADGYYKLDVYLYYIITLMLPIIYGRVMNHK